MGLLSRAKVLVVQVLRGLGPSYLTVFHTGSIPRLVTVVVLECVNMYLLTYLLTHWSEENGSAVVILPVLFGADFGTTPYSDRQLILNYSRNLQSQIFAVYRKGYQAYT